DGEPQGRFVAGGDRVVEPETLDELAVAPAALVRRDDVIERALLGTTARQADDDHLRFPSSGNEKPAILARTGRSGNHLAAQLAAPPRGPPPRIAPGPFPGGGAAIGAAAPRPGGAAAGRVRGGRPAPGGPPLGVGGGDDEAG